MGDIQELVERSRRGDRDAFRSLVEAHLDPVWRLALHLTRHEADAEDLSQEAFLRAWRGIATFRGESSFKTWICRIVMNVHVTRRSTESRRPATTALDASAAESREHPVHAVAIACELSQRVREALLALPEKQRVALELAVNEGMSVGEIAAVLGTPAENVKANLWHARRRLREVLGGELKEVLP